MGSPSVAVLGLVGLLLGTSALAQTFTDPNLTAETVVSGLSSPTTMAFLANDDILVLQKNDGQVRRVLGGVLQPNAVLDVAVDNTSERGLVGIVINTETPPKVFLYYAESSDPVGDGLPGTHD